MYKYLKQYTTACYQYRTFFHLLLVSDVFYIILWASEGIALVASTSIDTVIIAIPTHTPIFTLIYI